ncbi:MAG: MFS transporter [Chloroflexi bacterium]|nr:MFS transporter [Chloroflexota bacterium]MYD48617.1 MFS transporter [Chloroflexota bacterium]
MRGTNYHWVILTAGFAILFFNGGSRSALALMLKPMAEDLGWTRSVLSLGITEYMLVSALAMPFVGRLADRYDLRWITGAGVVIGGVGIGLMSVVSAPWQLFLVYGVVFALGNSAISNPIVSVMIVRWFPQRRGVANSVAVSGNATGQLVIVGLLAQSLARFDWRPSFAALGVANLAILAPIVLLAVRSAPRHQETLPQPESGESSPGAAAAPVAETPPPEQPKLLTSGQLWLLGGIYAICGFQDFFVATHVVAFSLDIGIGTVLAGNLLALMGLMGLLGVLTAGFLADRMGPGRPTLLCFVMRIGIFALVVWSQTHPAVIVFALLYGFTFLMTAPLTVIFSGNIFGSARLGRVSGTISGIHQVSGGLGALVGALAFDIWGSYDRAFLLMLALSVAATMGTLLVRDGGARTPGTSTHICA